MTEPELPEITIGMRLGVAYREMRFRAPRVSVGRGAPGTEGAPDIDLSQDESVSRQHAELRWIGDGYSIVDLGSTNGTWVNGKRIEPDQPLRLKDGDRVAVGRLSVLTVRMRGSRDAGSPPAV